MSVEGPISDPAEALTRAVTAVGSQAAMGRLLGVTQGAVSKWVRKAHQLPPEHVISVEAATGISRHDLRPDIYPRHSAAEEPASTPARFEAAR